MSHQSLMNRPEENKKKCLEGEFAFCLPLSIIFREFDDDNPCCSSCDKEEDIIVDVGTMTSSNCFC